MIDLEQSGRPGKDRLLMVGVIALGALLFLLLFFADKTNLDNDQRSSVVRAAEAAGTGANQDAALPPLGKAPLTDGLIARLDGKEGEEKVGILDSIVLSLQARNRLAYAADYAAQRADLSRSLEHQLIAGELSLAASHLDYVVSVEALFSRYSRQSIRYLQQVIDSEPKNERALISLGVALTESGDPQNTMQGIMSLRKVLEINPDNQGAIFYMGMFSMQSGQHEKARQRFERYLELDPENTEVRLQLAIALMQLSARDEARDQLKLIIASSSATAEEKNEANRLLNDID